jgi:hypothetical protein
MTDGRKDTWQGHWTMPDGREHPGTLTFSEGKGALLRVFGSRSNPMDEPVRWAQALHGVTLGGQAMTLLDVALFHHENYISGEEEMPTSEEWRSHTLIVGVHINSEEDLEFSVGTFRLAGLEEWLTDRWEGVPFFAMPAPPLVRRPRRRRRRGPARLNDRRGERVRRAMLLRHARAVRIALAYVPEGRISGRVEGASIQAILYEQRNIEGRFREVTERLANFQVTLDEPLGLHRWEREWIGPLQDLLVLCMGRHISIESLTAHFRMDAPTFLRPALSDRRTMPFSVAVRRREMAQRSPSGRYERILLPRNALASEGERFLREWFRLHRRIARAAPFFFSTIHESSQWLENQLLNLTSFAEAYHERLYDHPRFDPTLNAELVDTLLPQIEDPEARTAWQEKTSYAAKMTQRKRLCELVTWASEIVTPLEQFPRLVAQLIDTRNHLTHFGPGTKWVVDDHDLVRAVQRLTVVLQTNLLSDIGGTDDAVALAIARGYQRSPVLAPAEEVRVQP